MLPRGSVRHLDDVWSSAPPGAKVESKSLHPLPSCRFLNAWPSSWSVFRGELDTRMYTGLRVEPSTPTAGMWNLGHDGQMEFDWSAAALGVRLGPRSFFTASSLVQPFVSSP